MSCDALIYLAMLLFNAICLPVYTMDLVPGVFIEDNERHFEVGVNYTEYQARNELDISIAVIFPHFEIG